MGEGATFFVLSSEKKNAVAAIEGVGFSYKPKSMKDIMNKLDSFLAIHNKTLESIDCVLFGFSGDKDFDKYMLEILPILSNSTATGHFKQLCGDYHTAGAFATWMANKIIEKQKIPDAVKINTYPKKNINSVLIINGYLGINYSFTLITKC